MNKSRYLLVLLVMVMPHVASAIPAYPWPQTALQPDGTEITYRLQGDEYSSQMVSSDGYLLTRKADGTICYADRLHDGSLKPVRIAHDLRSADENDFLATRQRAARLDRKYRPVYSREKSVSREGFRGLVILVNYTNQKIAVPNADEFYGEMINSRNYNGYIGQDGEKVELTGSVRDYFHDNSGGLFNPEFDVVGPVELNVPSTFPMQMQNAPQLISLALTAADPLVDFSRYDSDGDGQIELIWSISYSRAKARIIPEVPRYGHTSLRYPVFSSMVSAHGHTHARPSLAVLRARCRLTASGPFAMSSAMCLEWWMNMIQTIREQEVRLTIPTPGR